MMIKRSTNMAIPKIKEDLILADESGFEKLEKVLINLTEKEMNGTFD